jgi:hypothetical protein
MTSTGPGQLGNGTTALGMYALKKQIDSISTTVSIGRDNTAYGHEALENLNAGQNESTAVGSQALSNSVTGENSAFGAYAGERCTGTGNTALGSWCLRYVKGDKNTAGGHRAMAGDDNVEGKAPATDANGQHNTAIGFTAYRKDPSGSYNTACGALAMRDAIGLYASQNTAVGFSALVNLDGSTSSHGYSNSAFGYSAGSDVKTGENNTFIGCNSGVGVTTGSYRTSIGAGSTATQDSTIILGRPIEDRVGIGTTAPTAKLHVVSNNGVAVNIEGGLIVNTQIINNITSTVPVEYVNTDAYMISIGGTWTGTLNLPDYPNLPAEGRVYAIHNNTAAAVSINCTASNIVAAAMANNTYSLGAYHGITFIYSGGYYCAVGYY